MRNYPPLPLTPQAFIEPSTADSRELREFRNTLEELRMVIYPAWSIEDLLCSPKDAMLFAECVRRRTGNSGLLDSYILRTLLDNSKTRKEQK